MRSPRRHSSRFDGRGARADRFGGVRAGHGSAAIVLGGLARKLARPTRETKECCSASCCRARATSSSCSTSTATYIAEGARAFIRADPALRRRRSCATSTPARSAHAERAGRQDHRRGEPAAAQDLHHADRPRADPRPDQRDGRRPRPAAGRERDDVALRRAGDERRHPAPGRPERASAASACSTRSRCCPGSASPTVAEAALKTCEEIDRSSPTPTA